jgi:hypothetical protein
MRPLLTAASLVSALLMILMAALWPRTLRIDDKARYITRAGTELTLETGPGRLQFRWSRTRIPVASEYLALDPWKPGGSFRSAPWGTRHSYTLTHNAMGSSGEYSVQVDDFAIIHQWLPPEHAFLGVGWERTSGFAMPPLFVGSGKMYFRRVVMPLWFLILACRESGSTNGRASRRESVRVDACPAAMTCAQAPSAVPSVARQYPTR